MEPNPPLAHLNKWDSMNRNTQLINERYDALMFATSPKTARQAASELVRVVLGESAIERPLEDALREVCRKIRPSEDPKEQARFESEFVELAIAPTTSRQMAA
jgi:hypothetical protein